MLRRKVRRSRGGLSGGPVTQWRAMSRLAEIAAAQFRNYGSTGPARAVHRLREVIRWRRGASVLRCLEPLAHDTGTKPTAHSHAGTSWWDEWSAVPVRVKWKLHYGGEQSDETQKLYFFHCPGCEYAHGFHVPHWTWNGSMESPTFTPSLMCNRDDPPRRFSFLRHRWKDSVSRRLFSQTGRTNGRNNRLG